MKAGKKIFLKIHDLLSPIQMQTKIIGITITNARVHAYEQAGGG
jgi:hypothetical protein